MRARVASAVATIFGLTASCSFFADYGGLTGGEADAAIACIDRRGDGGGSADCPITPGGDACDSLPRFLAPVQNIDGVGDEFCGVAATELDAAKSDPSRAADFPEKMYVRAAWSCDALHVHIHVDDANVNEVAADSEDLYYGDAVEIYARGSAQLDGSYLGTDDPGAYQILLTPPSPDGSVLARAQLRRGGGLVSTLSGHDFAGRIVPGGYEVELTMSWSDLDGAPYQGGKVGFDFLIWATNSTPAPTGDRISSTYRLQPIAGASSCTEPPAAFCDDRTWCTPTLAD